MYFDPKNVDKRHVHFRAAVDKSAARHTGQSKRGAKTDAPGGRNVSSADAHKEAGDVCDTDAGYAPFLHNAQPPSPGLAPPKGQRAGSPTGRSGEPNTRLAKLKEAPVYRGAPGPGGTEASGKNAELGLPRIQLKQAPAPRIKLKQAPISLKAASQASVPRAQGNGAPANARTATFVARPEPSVADSARPPAPSPPLKQEPQTARSFNPNTFQQEQRQLLANMSPAARAAMQKRDLALERLEQAKDALRKHDASGVSDPDKASQLNKDIDSAMKAYSESGGDPYRLSGEDAKLLRALGGLKSNGG